LRFRAPIERHPEALARFAVFPASKIATWNQTKTFVVDATMNGTSLGRRSMVFWKERDGWFIGITDSACKKAGVDTGDVCTFELTLVEDFVPEELSALLKNDKFAADVWRRLSPSGQRMHAMQIQSAKQPATRMRRAEKLVQQLTGKL
ncbi:MAG: YdeI/OmpD-associated family protein, partial [Betaproteobacteria bacterium]|nr:YdeI/OmpD-associated family protein [Betaproteobacteria bacterium]